MNGGKNMKFLFLKILIIISIYTVLKIQHKFFWNKSELGFYQNISSLNYIKKKIEFNNDNNKFAIIQYRCKICGLFSFYIYYLGCVGTYLSKGYIPIIDLSTFPNMFNGFKENSSKNNPWESFFSQPFGFSLKKVIKNAKYIKYFKCENIFRTYPDHKIYNNIVLMDFYHSISSKYIPVKKEIISEANILIKKLFRKSKNVLGILARGTDYFARKPKYHPIPPNISTMIYDIKSFDIKYNYDFFFLSTEDDTIRKKLIKKFKHKLKYLKLQKNTDYNFTSKQFLCYNRNIKENFNFAKIYLINIIILSKCLDIISARTGGAIGLFILTKGFRNTKVYNLGRYK